MCLLQTGFSHPAQPQTPTCPYTGALHCTSALHKASIALESAGCKSELDGEGSRASEGKKQLGPGCLEFTAKDRQGPECPSPNLLRNPMAISVVPGTFAWAIEAKSFSFGDLLLGRS